MLFALILSLLGGCFKLPKNIIPKPSDSQSDTDNETTADKEDVEDPEDNGQEDDSNSGVVESLAPAQNPSQGFSNYSTYKSAAYDRISTASEGNDSLAMTVGLGYLGVTMIDLSLLPLTSLVGDPDTSQAAMSFLFTDAKVSGNGNDFTITYKDSDGGEVKQTCTYDPGKDQMTSTMLSSDGSIGIFFEYVNLGEAYAAQYYYPSDDGYEVIRAYFDKDNVAAFGILTASDEPASIMGQSNFNEKFVENEQSYVILVDGKLTVFDNGTTTTN
jgi:hypothetical protein